MGKPEEYAERSRQAAADIATWPEWMQRNLEPPKQSISTPWSDLTIAWIATASWVGNAGWMFDGLRAVYVNGLPDQWLARAIRPGTLAWASEDATMTAEVLVGYGLTPPEALHALAVRFGAED